MLNENFKICFRTLQTCIYDDDFLKQVLTKIAYKYKEQGYKTYYKSNCLIIEIPMIKNKDAIDTLISLFELVIIYFQIGNKGVIEK